MNKWRADRKISGMAYVNRISQHGWKRLPPVNRPGATVFIRRSKWPSARSCSDSSHGRFVRTHVRLLIRRRRALPMTETELKLMAAAAIIGLRSRCAEIGYSTPAAIGTPKAL